MEDTDSLRTALLEGQVIPAHPLALTRSLAIDERHQRALTRYYVDAGAGGMAVGVHTTGFPIHDPRTGLYEPVLELAALTATDSLTAARSPSAARAFVRVAGLVGDTEQALEEAAIARRHHYHCGLLSLGMWRDNTASEVLSHCRAVAEAIPLFGFYLQPDVGGRPLDYSFWREFAEIPNVVAIKVAPFNRYATLDVLRAIADSGRSDIALYTGNDDNIVSDLVTDIAADIATINAAHNATHNATHASPEASRVEPYFAGGLLGQWAVWTHAAVQLLNTIREWRRDGRTTIPRAWHLWREPHGGERCHLRRRAQFFGLSAGHSGSAARAGIGEQHAHAR